MKADRQGEQPGHELPEQKRVAIDRLRQDARKRAPVVLAVHRVEAKSDRDQRHQERQQRDQRQRSAAGEQTQEQERILGRDLLDLVDRAAHDRDRGRHHENHQHHHENAGEVIRDLFQCHDPEAVQG